MTHVYKVCTLAQQVFLLLLSAPRDRHQRGVSRSHIPKGALSMSFENIVIVVLIVLIVLFVLGYFGRGRMRG